MEIEIRSIAEDELEEFVRADSRAFGNYPSDEDVKRGMAVTDPTRTFAAFDAGALVGATSSIPIEMAVPGAHVAMAGVTDVSVQSTHRRQGILTRLMERQLHDLHEAGEPMAALYCSESIIYGRYGYGISTFAENWTIERQHTAIEHAPERRGRVRFVTPEEALAKYRGVYERVWSSRPGMVKRSEAGWQKLLRDPERHRGGASAYFHVVYEREGRVDGYVVYRVKSSESELLVRELMAATDEAYAALWQYLFGVDLISSTEAWSRPVDDPLLWMLADPRMLKRRPGDALWLRLVDLRAALSARRYARSGRVVLEVRDGFCPWNEGRVELDGGPDGAECSSTERAPDIVLSAADLGAAYLGAVSFGVLSRAGRVEAKSAEALSRADTMFATERQPWCADFF